MASPEGDPRQPARERRVAASVDVRAVSCPLTWVRTRVALDRLRVGELLEVLLLSGEPLQNVPRTAEEEGHRLVAREPWSQAGEGAWRVLLAKGETPPEGGLLP